MEFGHEISTSQMQYTVDFKETDQENRCFLYLRAVFEQRLIGPLASSDVTWRNVHRTFQSQHTRDWWVLSWSMVV